MQSQSPTVGIVGVGTVGGALLAAFKGTGTRVLLNDPALGDRSTPLEVLTQLSSVVFLAVPSPMAQDGDADLSAWWKVVEALTNTMPDPKTGPVVCVRSAIPPDAIAATLERHPALRLVVAPEFLRERTPVEDMLAMRALVLGGTPADCAEVERLFREHSRVTGPMRVSDGLDAVGAALLKYQENCFLALKVSFMNEFFDLFKASGSAASWEAMQTAFHLDRERMGTTHWNVPGPDGQRGWGGKCFPKDVAALRAWGERRGVDTPLMAAMVARNDRDRNE